MCRFFVKKIEFEFWNCKEELLSLGKDLDSAKSVRDSVEYQIPPNSLDKTESEF